MIDGSIPAGINADITRRIERLLEMNKYYSIRHIYRQANAVADTLCKIVPRQGRGLQRLSDIPDALNQAIQDDVNGLTWPRKRNKHKQGCSVREKHRATRRSRSVKSDIDHCCHIEKDSISKSLLESGLKSLSYRLSLSDSNPNNTDNNISTNLDDHGLGYCTEEQLEEFILKNLEALYNEAIVKLVALGYDDDVALKAILRNGHCYGGMDALTNVLHNSLAYLNSSSVTASSNGSDLEEPEAGFPDLRQLKEYSLAGLVCSLQQARPYLNRGDAMWCLLLTDLHVGKASTMEIPSLPNNLDSIGDNGVGVVSPGLCRFHGGAEFSMNGFFSNAMEMTLQRDIECPKRFNLSPSLKSLLKRNVAMFAASFGANSKRMQTQKQACVAPTSSGDAPLTVAEKAEEESTYLNCQDGVNSLLSKFRDFSIDESLEHAGADKKGEMIVSLLRQINDLEKQVKERKEWAHQKAMQAARKLSSDLTELKILRMEREEMQQIKKGKHTIDYSIMKRLLEMENAPKKASGQVDRANAAVRRLETENAEMQASKLSASESVTTCHEVAKREKKGLKKLLAWEKQRLKLQDEIADEKEKVKELQRCLARVQQDQKETESMWKEELKAKELALAQLEQERRSKEAAEASNKRKLEALRLKIEIDFQCHKDDHQRLEQELSRLKPPAQSTEFDHQSDNALTGKSEGAKPQGETIARLPNELYKVQDSSENEVVGDRECIVCSKDEVSILFLPCAHQVLCANCNDSYGKKGKATCPYCRVPIEQRIRVFGATS